LTRLVAESTQASEQHLRFQLPSAVLPLKVARARLLVKIDARGRQVSVAGRADDAFVELHSKENPLGPIQVDITAERFLRLDADGGLHLRLTVHEPEVDGRANPSKWTIEYIELEVSGMTETRDANRNSR